MEKNVENDIRGILGLKEGVGIPPAVEQLVTSTKRAADRCNIPFGRPQELLLLCLIAEPKAFLKPPEPEQKPNASKLPQGKG